MQLITGFMELLKKSTAPVNCVQNFLPLAILLAPQLHTRQPQGQAACNVKETAAILMAYLGSIINPSKTKTHFIFKDHM